MKRVSSTIIGWRPPFAGASCLLLAGSLGLACLASLGCGKKESFEAVQGAVTCGGEKVLEGRITFIPLGDATGPNCTATITDGQYRIEPPGGVRLGKYRVVLDAQRKTGKKVRGRSAAADNMGSVLIDQTVRVGPAVYAGGQSPLVADITADFDGQFDIAIPR